MVLLENKGKNPVGDNSYSSISSNQSFAGSFVFKVWLLIEQKVLYLHFTRLNRVRWFKIPAVEVLKMLRSTN